MRTIAWDIDDVLNDLMQTWLEDWWRPAHPDCVRPFEQLTDNPPHRLLDTSLAAYLASLDAFRLSGRYAQLAPRPELLHWFAVHGERFRHVALTAVPLRAASVSAEWLLRHFGRWIRSFHLVPSRREGEELPAYDASKEAFLRRVGGVDVLVDDNPAHVRGAQECGVQAFLFPRPWNDNNRTQSELLEELAR